MNFRQSFFSLACLLAVGGIGAGKAAAQPAPTEPRPPAAPITLEDRFKQMDKNGDGVLTPDESPSPTMFQRMDANNDGKVTLEEFKTMAMNMHARQPQPQVREDDAMLEKRFKMLDKNGDGVLTPDESPNPIMLKRMDTNGDGKVTLEEFKAAALKMPGMQGGTTVDARFKQLDKNGDGVLTPDEFPNPQLFKVLDKNQDGKLTLDEVRAYGAGAQSPDRQTIKKQEMLAAAEAKMQINRDIRYTDGPGTDPKLNALDIYAPARPLSKKEAAGRPVVVFVHGGNWSVGDKKDIGAKAAYFTGADFDFVSINYRLSPAVKHPEHARDVAAALAWVHENIKKYGGNPDAIYLMGHSAGAQLATLVAMDEKYLKEKGAGLSLIKGVVLLDCPALIFDGPKLKEIKDRIADVFGTDEAAMKDATPLEHLAKGKGIPPMLFLAASDLGWEQAHVESAVLSMRAAGVRAELIDARAFKDHMTINGELGLPDDPASQMVMEFLKSLRPGAPHVASLGETKVLSQMTKDEAAISPATGSAAVQPTPAQPQMSSSAMKAYFEKLDANHDMKISPDEAPPWLKPHFNMADVNKDGFLDYGELEIVVQKMLQMSHGGGAPHPAITK